MSNLRSFASLRMTRCDASLRNTLGGRAQTRLVAIGGVVLDQALFGCLVDLRETAAEVSFAGLHCCTGLLERALQTRFAGAIPNGCFFGLTALFFGRANVSHELL